DLRLFQIQLPDLMVASHRYEQIPAAEQQIPRTIQRSLKSGSALSPVLPLLACSGYRLDGLPTQVQSANKVILSIGYIKSVAFQSQPLGIVERGPVERPIVVPSIPGAGYRYLVPFKIGDDDAMVRAVGYEQAMALCVGQNFSRKIERTIHSIAEFGEIKV